MKLYEHGDYPIWLDEAREVLNYSHLERSESNPDIWLRRYEADISARHHQMSMEAFVVETWRHLLKVQEFEVRMPKTEWCLAPGLRWDRETFSLYIATEHIEGHSAIGWLALDSPELKQAHASAKAYSDWVDRTRQVLGFADLYSLRNYEFGRSPNSDQELLYWVDNEPVVGRPLLPKDNDFAQLWNTQRQVLNEGRFDTQV